MQILRAFSKPSKSDPHCKKIPRSGAVDLHRLLPQVLRLSRVGLSSPRGCWAPAGRAAAPLEAKLRRKMAMCAGTQHLLNLTYVEEVMGEPENQGRKEEESLCEQLTQGREDFGESCGSFGKFHLVSSELRCLWNQGHN